MREHVKHHIACARAEILLPLQGGGGEGDGFFSFADKTHPHPNPPLKGRE